MSELTVQQNDPLAPLLELQALFERTEASPLQHAAVQVLRERNALAALLLEVERNGGAPIAELARRQLRAIRESAA